MQIIEWLEEQEGDISTSISMVCLMRTVFSFQAETHRALLISNQVDQGVGRSFISELGSHGVGAGLRPHSLDSGTQGR